MANIGRRSALRLVAAASVAAVSGLAVTARPALAAQHLWGTCTRCRVLWFTGNGTRGGCPAGDILDGGHHHFGIDWMVKTVEDGGAGQPGWRWCAWCQALWFNGGTGGSACPSSRISAHSPIGPVVVGQPTAVSGEYVLEDITNRDRPGGFSGWRWCFKCSGLWDATSNSLYTGNVCPRDRQPHSLAGSGDYLLRRFGSTR
ncbi:hypothetical protein HTZ77_08265 [Nonomuraea sp. SMC257]|uniref:Twin-arginine translocation signal domain-containing protein n=1 Tax=Nonomuraea montanisoli TaxID=2741721 RepID=A0A7Y6I4Q0_9ACTN|nr:hypothetical protein [Nonomuraea montanisoli]NUW31416.1 hypothetical protein [Nonomuraea montanisoli]